MKNILLIINNILPIILLLFCLIYWLYQIHKEFQKEKNRKFAELIWGALLSTITLVIYTIILFKKY